MNLKDWLKLRPHWVKGGFIGIVVLIILVIAVFIESTFFTNLTSSGVPPMGVFTKIIVFSLVPLMPFGIFDSHEISFIPIIYIFLVGIYYFLIGAIIGKIYGKIKSKV